MAIASIPHVHPLTAPTPICCHHHLDDARSLAAAVIAGALGGPALDIGCGEGGVSLAVLAARPDVSILGVDIAPEPCRRAETVAARRGLGARFRSITGSVFEVPLPPARQFFTNPPLLPGEPGFFHASPDGTRDLFWAALIRLLATRERTFQLWIHLFDFHGIERRTGRYLSLREVADQEGLGFGLVHCGLREAGRHSAIAGAVPALRRVFPDGEIVVDGVPVPLGRLPHAIERPFGVPHSVAVLSRDVPADPLRAPSSTSEVLQ